MVSQISNTIRKHSLSALTEGALRMIGQKFGQWRLKKKITSRNIKRFFNEPNFEKIHENIIRLPALPIKDNILNIKQKGLHNEDAQRIIQEADHYCKLEFNILGSGWVNWSKNNEMAWHYDFNKDYFWDKNLYYTEISKIIRQQIHTPQQQHNDCKIPRELSRFYFLQALSFSYFYTSDEKYLSRIKYLILHWIEENPPYYGVNWSNAMETSIRIFNWCICIYALKNELKHDPSFLRKFYTSLYYHFQYITHNLERVTIRNNHYVANLVGVFVIAQLFPIFKESDKWLKWSLKELESEIKKQTYTDGGNFEGSTAYHCLAIDFFFYPLYLSEVLKPGLFTDPYKEKVRQLFFFLLNIIKPGGALVQFGDNDSGRLLKLLNRSSLQQSYLLGFAQKYYNDNGFSLKEFPIQIEASVLLGGSLKANRTNKSKSVYNLAPHAFTKTGIYTLRNKNFYIAVSCMPNGQHGKGIHTHNDKLSFELNLREHNIIVDPGTFTYLGDSQIRTRMRSTSYHNTVQELDFEQNGFGDSIFELHNDAIVQVDKFNDFFIDCQHDGFVSKGGHIHQRTIQLSETEIVIRDIIHSENICKAFVHLGPEIEVVPQNNIFLVSKNSEDLLHFQFENHLNKRIEEYSYSPGYGEMIICKKLVIEFRESLEFKISKC